MSLGAFDLKQVLDENFLTKGFRRLKDTVKVYILVENEKITQSDF